MVHIFNGILLSLKKEWNWVICRDVEGNGTPLQYFCLENPMDRGAWWAAVHGVARVGHDWSHAAAAADRFRVCYSEWSKSDKEKILCINASMCSVKIWYKMIISFLLLAQPTGT